MNRLVVLLIVMAFSNVISAQPLERVIKKYFPKHQDSFVFKKSTADDDPNINFFEIYSEKGKIVVCGDNNVSLASGLNWYFKYYCNVNISECGNQLHLDKKLPQIDQKVRIETDMVLNTYMNYCTFGYTTVFWDWQQWEREIDYMALNGINLPLAVVGLEVVWRNTLKHFGFDDESIKEFFTGPTHLPWLWMGNLEQEAGELPDEWFEQQEQLQKKIVARMREWDMEPVFQGFTGVVPCSLYELFPESMMNTIEQGKWVGIDKRSPILLSTDPLFTKMAEYWYEEYERLYGENRYFGGDLFHEGGKTRGLNITEIARGVQTEMMKYNPKAVWVLQSWQTNPRKELLDGLKKENTLVVELATEFWQNWKNNEGFWGFPFLAGHVTNYGGNFGLHGRLDDIAKSSVVARNHPYGASLKGVAALPEGIEVNPVAFELGNEMRWRSEVPDINEWVRNYSIRRYGIDSENLKRAWEIFYKTAYGTFEDHRRPSESIFCARPSLDGIKAVASAWGQTRVYYDKAEFAKGVQLLLSEASTQKKIESYEYDVVDFTRQFIGDIGRETYYAMVDAYNAKDRDKFKELSDKFLNLILDQDRLLSSYAPFFVGRWIDLAKNRSNDPENQNYYENCARMIITTWTEDKTSLSEYANKEWGGILKDVYYVKWRDYIDVLTQKLDGNEVVEFVDPYIKDSKWVKNRDEYVIDKSKLPIDIAIELFNKYY